MTTATNIRINSNVGASFLAPRFSKKTNTIFVFAYLAMITIILLTTGTPFESATARSFGAATRSVSDSTQTIVVEIPGNRIPTAPYIIFERAH